MEIQPFTGYRYNLDKINCLDDVVAPPYDVIDDKLQDKLYERHPNNVVRLILNRISSADSAEDNRYIRASKTLSDWVNDKILIKDTQPSIYVYHQVFEFEEQTFVRKGFMCRCLAVPFGYGMVYPHEITMSAPKLDRLMLTTACKMNFSQVFGIYPDEQNEIQSLLDIAVADNNIAPITATDHLGVQHKTWVLNDTTTINAVVKLMETKPIFIADGHHRYETACNYRQQIDEMGLLHSQHPANYVLMVCIAKNDAGLIVMPTHRLFTGIPQITSEILKSKLDGFFELESSDAGIDAASVVWERIKSAKSQDVIGLFTAQDHKWNITKITPQGKELMDKVAPEHHPEWRELGVSLLHRLIVETLLGVVETPKPCYVHLVQDLISAFRQKPDDYQLAALVQPANVNQIETLCLLNDCMPAKSTYFYPKLIAGLVVNPLDDNIVDVC
ncbi:MAG: DUF1015 domain-containing protein [Planctomycetaceae bacterium]|jgi:uncharacterized protein (DUF1015 family)|nr:DUF1015 domain-containing protein [Planctomycetaceae bacterium]